MRLCEAILISIIGTLGIYVSVTDIQRGMIQNKALISAGMIGFIINLIYYINFAREFMIVYLSNFFVMSFLSIALYGFSFWAAGDSKLLMLITFLFPARFYDIGNHMIAPGVYILVIIFLLAYLYVIADTVIQFFRKEKFYRNIKITSNLIRNFIKQYFISFLYLRGFSRLLQVSAKNIYYENQIIFTFLNIFIAMLIHKKKIFKRWYCIGFLVILNVGLTVFYYNFSFHSMMFKSYGILLLAFLIRYLVSGYNYREIPTENVRKGMVLSYGTVAKFFVSRVKGLPKKTSEDMKYRISEEEARAIKRWESSKHGESSIVIVRKIPFAIFIIIGTFIFFMIRVLR